MNTRVWDVLLNFSKGFSRYDLEVAFSLESPYSMRLYEMLCGQEYPITMSIDSLRKEFKLEDKYPMTKDFIRRVVESARCELDKKSPVTFTYRPVKDGKRFTRLLFFPVRQSKLESRREFFHTAVREYGIGSSLSSDEFRLLREIGFTENGIKNNLGLFLECEKKWTYLWSCLSSKGNHEQKKARAVGASGL